MKFGLTFIVLLLPVLVHAQRLLPPSSVDSLANIASRSQGIDRARALYELSKVYTVINIDSTRRFIDEAVEICRKSGNDTTYIQIVGGMQEVLARVGEIDLSQEYLLAAKSHMAKHPVKLRYQNLIYVGLYFNHFWNYTRYDSSVYYGLLTVDIAPDSLARADRLIIVGAAYNKMGDNIKALEYYNMAQGILDELQYYPEEHCYLYNQLGMLYADEGDLKKAEDFYLKSIAIGKEKGFPKISPVTNLATIYDKTGDYNRSLKYLDSASILMPDEYDPWRAAIAVRIKGKVLTHAGKPKEGIEATLRAMNVYSQLKDNYTVARLHLQLAEAYRMLRDYRKAESEALIALEWDRIHGYGELVKESYWELSRLYAATGQYGKAFEFQDRYVAILDSLNSSERRNKFAQLENSLEFAAQERRRLDLEKENEVYLAQVQADEKVRIYFTLGILVLTIAVIIAIAAYRRTRSQNFLLNQQNKKIEDQAQQIQEAAKAKSRFFANVSHELRTPVTLLNGMLELMQQNPSRNGTTRKLDIALVSSRRLQGMLDEVLDLSRVEAGELKLSRQPKELLPLLNRVVFAFESLTLRKNIKLEYNAVAIEGLVIGIDEDKFEKVINNLIYNAIKFNRDGGWIRVTAERTETSVVIQVADSGIGIPEKELPFVFDRFFQSGATDRLNSQGIGIGLSLVREFTELHGGDVTVTSRIGEGSCFTVQLPIIFSETSNVEPGDDLPELPEVDFNSFSRKPRILIVEDNDEMRYYLEEILGDGVWITEARNGYEGLKKLESNIPDLVITDVMMPEMDGVEFLSHLKRSKLYKGIPVIMLTARASQEDLMHGLSLGVDDYIIKPFNARELKIRVRNLIANQEIRREWNQKPAEADELVAPVVEGEDDLFMKKIIIFVEENASNASLSIGDLCDHLAISERQFYRKAATLAGMTPALLVKEIRMKIAYRLLLERKVVKVSDLAKRVGFENTSYFSRQFQERFGKRPSEFL